MLLHFVDCDSMFGAAHNQPEWCRLTAEVSGFDLARRQKQYGNGNTGVSTKPRKNKLTVSENEKGGLGWMRQITEKHRNDWYRFVGYLKQQTDVNEDVVLSNAYSIKEMKN